MAAVGKKPSSEQVLRFRLAVSHLTDRLPVAHLATAAEAGLQDGSPWSGLLSLNARVDDVDAESWRHPDLAQVFGPRGAVYLVPAADTGVFTLGLLPADPGRADEVRTDAKLVEDILDGGSLRQRDIITRLPDIGGTRGLRWAATAGTLSARWDTVDVIVTAVPAPDIEPEAARLELARRFFTYAGPASTADLAWWLDAKPPLAQAVVAQLRAELEAVAGKGPDRFVTAEVAPLLADPPPPPPVLLLPPDDVVFNRRVTRPYVAPEVADAVWPKAPPPGALFVDGEIAGTWRRRGRNVSLTTWHTLTTHQLDQVEAAVDTFPLPGDEPPTLTVESEA